MEWLSWSQKPSHLTVLEGWISTPSSRTGEEQRGDLSFGVRQWMRSVLGTENVRLMYFALLVITLYMR